MRRTASWIVVLAVSVLLSGCGSSGIEPGMPSQTDMNNIPDPMAGVKTQAPAKAKPITKKAAP
ncbi:hypothetical protein [Planctomyces sp. SH-PL62]|uniref:hypothetical protein n=1 Tax=Planctomyces sp. SH-PL62 TaxID=1636152 RepID=UPI00078C3830|nr:hypothetical protein [Planctomyces sp. SH-PL62]AMV36886.1 hypothetical protein VT85_05610 [Planctomyces sp. SH-PL62]